MILCVCVIVIPSAPLEASDLGDRFFHPVPGGIPDQISQPLYQAMSAATSPPIHSPASDVTPPLTASVSADAAQTTSADQMMSAAGAAPAAVMTGGDADRTRRDRAVGRESSPPPKQEASGAWDQYRGVGTNPKTGGGGLDIQPLEGNVRIS